MSELILRLKESGGWTGKRYGTRCKGQWKGMLSELLGHLRGSRRSVETCEAAEADGRGSFSDRNQQTADTQTGNLQTGDSTEIAKGETNTRQGAGTPDMDRAEQVFDRYGNAILRLAYSYLHNMSDAEDILQEVLIQYMKAAPAFNGEEHEKAWLLHVSANLCKNRIKYNKYRETDELMEELVAEKKEDLSFVWEAVRSLPEKYREVIHLFYQETLTTKEIAEVLGRKEATIRSDLLRGREKLKKILKEAYDFE